MKKRFYSLIPLITLLLGGCSINDKSNSTSNQSNNNGNSASTTSNVSNNGGGGPVSTSDDEEDIVDPENDASLLYKGFYKHSNDVKLTINISNEQFNKVMQYGHPDNVNQNDIYSPCKVTVQVEDQTRVFNDVGIRIKGNMSREDSATSFNGDFFNGHAHFKLSFNATFEDNPSYNSSIPVATLKERRFGKAKSINLKWNRNFDDEFVREAYAAYMMNQEGLMAQKMNNIQVTFETETSRNTYLYQVQENIDAQFLDKRFTKESQEGDLYKGGWVGSDALTLDNSSSSLFGVEDAKNNKFFVYDLKTNKNNSNMSNIKNMINMLKKNDNGASQDELKNNLNQYIDTDYMLRFMAMEWLIGNPDSLRYHYNNTYFYFSSGNGLMYPIMFDNDRCLGVKGGWISPIRYPSTTKTTMNNEMSSVQDSPLYWRMILGGSYSYPVVAEYRDKYFDYVEEYVNKYLNLETYNTFKGKFVNKDDVNGDNISFVDYCQEMKTQMNNCFADEGRV